MLKYLISVMAGLVAGLPVVMIVQQIGHRIIPPPEGIDFSDRDAVTEMIANLPVGAFLFVLLAWTLGAFTVSAVAARLARKPRPAYMGTAIFLGLCAVNFVMIPHPVWMVAATILLVPGAGLLGARLFAHKEQ